MNRTLEQRRCREERDERIEAAREQFSYSPPYDPFVSMDDFVTALVGTLKKPVSLPGVDAKTFNWTWPDVEEAGD